MEPSRRRPPSLVAAIIATAVATLSSTARAEAPPDAQLADADTPRARVLGRDLTARHRLDLRGGLGMGGGVASEGAVSATAVVAGSVAVLPQLEVFGRVAGRATSFAAFIDYRGPRPSSATMLSGLGGARYIASSGPWSIAPAVWVWTPTWGHALVDGAGWAAQDSVYDARAFDEQTAVGSAVAVSWRSTESYVQVDVGNAWVADGGPQVDNVFADFEAGTRTSPTRSIHGGVRVELLPTGANPGPRVRPMMLYTFARSADHGNRVSTWRMSAGGIDDARGIALSYETTFGAD